MSPTPSRFTGGLRVGSNYFAKVGALAPGEPRPRGVVESLSDLAHPGLDVTRVDPAVVAFFERTGELDLHQDTCIPHYYWFTPIERSK